MSVAFRQQRRSDVHLDHFTWHRVSFECGALRGITFALDHIAHFVDIYKQYIFMYPLQFRRFSCCIRTRANLHKRMNAIAFNTWRCNLFVNVNAPCTRQAMNTCGFDWQRHTHRKCYNFGGGARAQTHTPRTTVRPVQIALSPANSTWDRASHMCKREMRQLQMQTNLECNLMQCRRGRGAWGWRQPKNNSRTAAPDATGIGVCQLYGISVSVRTTFLGVSNGWFAYKTWLN